MREQLQEIASTISRNKLTDIPNGIFGGMGHFHADRAARIGQRAAQRHAGFVRRPGRQFDAGLRRTHLDALQRFPERAKHYPEPGRHPGSDQRISGSNRPDRRQRLPLGEPTWLTAGSTTRQTCTASRPNFPKSKASASRRAGSSTKRTSRSGGRWSFWTT